MLKTQRISLAVCGLVLSSTMAFGADTIDAAFKEGKVSGNITAYGVKTNMKDGKKDSNAGYGTIGLGYETGVVKGFSAKTAFVAGHAVADGSFEDSDPTITDDDNFKKALMTEAYIKYATDLFSLTAGRQAIDLEWLGDFNEAVVAAITPNKDTTIVLGYTNRVAVADEDEIIDFSEPTEDGAYVADIKYSGLQSVEFNPYYYSAPDAVDFYGLKTTFTADMFGAVAHYAKSSVDKSMNAEDGSIGHVELNTTISDFTAAAGYIKTDKNGGVGLMDTYGDNINPFDSGNNVYNADAKTVYGSLGYTVASVELGALYGQTTYGTNDDFKEKELNLTAGYPITESLATSLLLADIDGEETDSTDGTVDQQYATLKVQYSF